MLLPVVAFAVSLLDALFFCGLLFLFADPAGNDVAEATYTGLAFAAGVAAVLAAVLGIVLLRQRRPGRGLAVAAIVLGGLTAAAVPVFIYLGFWFEFEIFA